ncbi:membrane hypothetical protein [Desulfarculales bacterium]
MYPYQLLASGITIGATYTRMALVMVIIYKTSEVLKLAQGYTPTLSAFVAFTFMTSQALAFAVVLSFAFFLEAFLAFAFLRRANDPTVLGLIIITLGLEMVIYGLALWKCGGDQKNFPSPVSDFTTYDQGAGVVMSQLNLATWRRPCS